MYGEQLVITRRTEADMRPASILRLKGVKDGTY